MLKDFSWFSFLLYGAMYSAFVFSGEASKDGPLIFSRRNRRPIAAILGFHAVFLAILLESLRLAAYFEPSLPDWMSDKAGRVGTCYDFFFVILMLIMGFIERRLIVVKADANSPDERENYS
jgi:hypothetical protein